MGPFLPWTILRYSVRAHSGRQLAIADPEVILLESRLHAFDVQAEPYLASSCLRRTFEPLSLDCIIHSAHGSET